MLSIYLGLGLHDKVELKFLEFYQRYNEKAEQVCRIMRQIKFDVGSDLMDRLDKILIKTFFCAARICIKWRLYNLCNLLGIISWKALFKPAFNNKQFDGIRNCIPKWNHGKGKKHV
ncbi:hypothetical protein MLD38_022986 [Melastoma candidum]|uniref:Uncharacterized protein n=1 Tax=Melastoma candidum TaxID=119954 RepID=A0ACB9QU88_9MYRT|nr:hypothetical protein MLD38_022986 [Melastoma candidum]